MSPRYRITIGIPQSYKAEVGTAICDARTSIQRSQVLLYDATCENERVRYVRAHDPLRLAMNALERAVTEVELAHRYVEMVRVTEDQ